MQISSALNTGIQGFQAAQERVSQAASDIASQSISDSTRGQVQGQANEEARNSVETKDLTTSLVNLKSAENDAKANANVIKTASDVLGSLLDINV